MSAGPDRKSSVGNAGRQASQCISLAPALVPSNRPLSTLRNNFAHHQDLWVNLNLYVGYT